MARLWRHRWLELSVKKHPVLSESQMPNDPRSDELQQASRFFSCLRACEKPENYGRPISHWTPRELADEVGKLGIVTSISPRHVGRLLAEADVFTAPVAILVESPRPTVR